MIMIDQWRYQGLQDGGHYSSYLSHCGGLGTEKGGCRWGLFRAWFTPVSVWRILDRVMVPSPLTLICMIQLVDSQAKSPEYAFVLYRPPGVITNLGVG